MDFGNPMFLWALPAALLPVILHLFFKRRKLRVHFSTLLFFVKKERYFAYRRKFYEMLLLALRILIILLLVLALSHIYFKRFNFISGGSTEAVIILDDSMSMQRSLSAGGTAFDFAKRKAEEILNSLSGDDGASLVMLSGRQSINLTRDKAEVLKRVRQSQLTAAAGSMNAAVQSAIDQLRKAPGLNREIYILSDFKKNSHPSRAIDTAALENCRVFCMQLGGSGENLSVEVTGLDSTPRIINRAGSIPYKVINHGKNTRDVRAELEIDGKTVQTMHLSVKGQSSASDRFLFTPARSGRTTGCVKINDENIPLDDKAFFSFAVSGCINVLLAREMQSGGADPFYFLRFAVDPVKNNPVLGIKTESIDINSLDAEKLDNLHILCLAQGSKLPDDKAVLIKRYLDNGGVLLTLPLDDSNQETYASLSKVSGYKISNVYRTIASFNKNGLNFNKPLSELNALLQLELIKWRKIQKLSHSDGNALAVNGEEPMIVEQPVGKGKWIALAFGLRRDFSNWPLLKSFPVGVSALINYAIGNRGKSPSSICGENIELHGDRISFTTNYGRSGEIKGKSGKCMFNENWLPGVVFFSGADNDAMVVRPDSSESETDVCGSGDIKSFFDSPVALLDSGADITSQVAKLRKGTDLAGPLLLLMLILIAAEFVLGGSPGMLLAAVKKSFNKRGGA
ncbi:MAG: vWA domain-containing protein [Victivallaceae bacterium]